MSEYTPEQIEQQANDLRDIYVHFRRMARPRYHPRGKDDAAWKQLAVLLRAQNLNGRHYVKWAYDFYLRNSPHVYVPHITSPKTVQIYIKNAPCTAKDREYDLKLKIYIQNNVLGTEMQLGRDLRAILIDEELAIGVVLRYAVSFSGGFKDLEEKFRAEAESEIEVEPLYRSILGDKLPPSGGGKQWLNCPT